MGFFSLVFLGMKVVLFVSFRGCFVCFCLLLFISIFKKCVCCWSVCVLLLFFCVFFCFVFLCVFFGGLSKKKRACARIRFSVF